MANQADIEAQEFSEFIDSLFRPETTTEDDLDAMVRLVRDREQAGKGADNPELDPYFFQGHCSEEEQKRKPFLTLRTPYSDKWNKATGLVGMFRLEKGILVFGARAGSRGTLLPLRIKGNIDQSIKALSRILCQSSCLLKLVGVASSGQFSAKGMHLLEIGEKKPGEQREWLRDAHLQYLLRRLFDHDQMQTDQTRDAPLFTSEEEIKLLALVCAETYPSAIQKWAERSIQTLESPNLGHTDKRHVLKALAYALNVDWSIHAPNIPELPEVRAELDKRFLGLESVKERILEVAAQVRRTRTLPKYGILLHGPAGVGKTAIANAISEIFHMPKAYLEFSVIRDSEGLTGTPRIYGNATPGMVIEQIYNHRTGNLVMVLNEIDKAAIKSGGGGNPLDTLLPLLDGMGFTDTYLGVTIPTEGILFIATCNELEDIGKPILDRFFRIDIPAYSMEEKRAIFERHVMPEMLERAQVLPEELSFTPDAEDRLLYGYAVEPGVRDLEQYMEKFISHYLMEKELNDMHEIQYTKEDLYALLGPPRLIQRNYTAAPGRAIGAYIRDGHPHIIPVQALLRSGTGELCMLNAGNGMQREYCRVAYEHLKSFLPGLAKQVDVIIALDEPPYESRYNDIGLAVCAAILSAYTRVTLPERSMFLGGCDLLGTVYLDENTLTPLLQCYDGQFDTIYSAYGASALSYNWKARFGLNIIEVPSIWVLFHMMQNRDA